MCAGVAASEFLDSNQPADLMLLDIQMPGKTGLEVVRDAERGGRLRLPIVAMTGHVDVDAQEEFRCVELTGGLGGRCRGGAVCSLPGLV